jgi:hypothetical protein
VPRFADLRANPVIAGIICRRDRSEDVTRRAALFNPTPDTVGTLSALPGAGNQARSAEQHTPTGVEIVARIATVGRFFEVTAFSYEIGACKPDPAPTPPCSNASTCLRRQPHTSATVAITN